MSPNTPHTVKDFLVFWEKGILSLQGILLNRGTGFTRQPSNPVLLFYAPILRPHMWLNQIGLCLSYKCFVFLFVFFVCYLCATISDEIVGEVFCERHKLASITSLLSEKHHHRHQHHTSKRRRTITTLLSAERHHCHHIWITSFSIYILLKSESV